MGHFRLRGKRKNFEGRKVMKVHPFSFSLMPVGFVFAVLFMFSSCFAVPAVALAEAGRVPEKILTREAREVRVFLKTQRFGFYEKGNLVFWGPVCSGRKGMETPKGRFRVLMKARDYWSRKYDGAVMPFAVQFSTGGHFLHVGEIRPKPASHGCVRLKETDAMRIFRAVKIGDPVIITD